MKMSEICKQCLKNKYQSKTPVDASPSDVASYNQALLRVIDENKHLSAPEVVEQIEKLHERTFGAALDYTAIKQHFNDLILSLEPQLWQAVETSDNPLALAVRYAMAGNFIDFGALDHVEEDKLRDFLNAANRATVNPSILQKLRHDIQVAKHLVYFTDNCGEIVADKILLRAIKQLNPNLHITAIVRGAPVLNDATEEDARQVDLASVAQMVIGNGTKIAGTVLSKISSEAKKAVQSADLLIAKGQGNYESLSGCGLNLYYIFMCKCELFVNRFGVPKYSGIITKENE